MDEPAYTRRRFLELGIIAGVVTVCAPESWAQTDTPTTPSTILGPYYPVIRARKDGGRTIPRAAGRGPRHPVYSMGYRPAARMITTRRSAWSGHGSALVSTVLNPKSRVSARATHEAQRSAEQHVLQHDS